MERHVADGAAPGLVTLVSRRGETHVEAIGTKAVGGGDPVRRDKIFRISSMTKPVIAAATMILVEECVLRLDEPVERLLPELSVVTGRDSVSAVPGKYGWDGGLGTTWASDPAEEMVAVMMSQRARFPVFSAAYLDFWTLAYQAIDD